MPALPALVTPGLSSPEGHVPGLTEQAENQPRAGRWEGRRPWAPNDWDMPPVLTLPGLPDPGLPGEASHIS